MPVKKGNGGHGFETYDSNTGKYVEDGRENKYYDNPDEVINEEAQAENLFGMSFQKPQDSFIEYIQKDDVVDDYGHSYMKMENPLDDPRHTYKYPDSTVDKKTGKIIFDDPEQVETFIREICQGKAFSNLLKFDKDFKKDGFKTVNFRGETRVIRNGQDLYKYYLDYKQAIAENAAKYENAEEWSITDDMLWDEKVNKVLNKLGLSSTEELVEKYNSLLDKFKMGNGAKKERKVVITTGLPASGKSIMGEKNDILAGIEIDSDIGKLLFPEYQEDKTMVSVVHSMSAVIRDVVLEEAIKQGYNISLPTVGSKSNMDYFLKLFKDNGYDAQIANIYVPFEDNVTRSVTRMLQTGRLTDFPVISKNLGSQLRGFKNIVNDFKTNGINSGISGYAFIDNTTKHTIEDSQNFKYSEVIKK